MPDFECCVNDRSTPLSVRIWEDGMDNDIASLTVKFAMFNSDETTKTAETATGITIMPGKTFTADSDTDKLTCNAHGMKDGWEVVVSNSGGALPTGLSATTRYFIRDATQNTFRLCTEPNAEYVNITGNGTGTQTVKAYGHVQYAWTANDVGTAGTYSGRFIVIDGSSLRRTFPAEQSPGLSIQINTAT